MHSACSVAEHLSFLRILSGALRRYRHLWKSRPPRGINWHIFKMQQSKAGTRADLWKAVLHCAKRWMTPKMLEREIGILVWVVESQVGFSTWGLLLLPWDHPCAELVTGQWIGRIQGGVKLL